MTTVISRYTPAHKDIVGGLTTEALIDAVEYCVLRVKVVYHGKLRRKYLEQATDLVGLNWSNGIRHKFVFDLADILKIDSSTAGELIELNNTTASTLERVLHQVVKRLFSQVSAAWVYENAAEHRQIEVVLKP